MYETLDMSALPDYTVGGTIHIIVNNQVSSCVSSIPQCSPAPQAPQFFIRLPVLDGRPSWVLITKAQPAQRLHQSQRAATACDACKKFHACLVEVAISCSRGLSTELW